MADNFIFSVNAVAPIFLIMSLGFLLRKKGRLAPQTINDMNDVVFTYALPVLLFRDVYSADFTGIFDLKLILWAVGGVVASFIGFWVFAAVYLKKKPESIGAFVQGAFRANYAILGLPLAANILGDANTGKSALVVTFVVPLFNIFSVVVLSVTQSQKSFLRQTIINVCKNPLVIGIFSGIAVSLLPFKLPAAFDTTVHYMGALCTPLALLAVGGSIQIAESMKNIKPAVTASLLKIVLSPLAVLVPAVLFAGFKGEELVVLFVLFATPSAVSSYIMSYKMGADAPLASHILIITTVFSVFTFTAGIYLLKSFMLI